jgi:hypothetical protein
MTIEAVLKKVISAGNVVQKLRKRPELISHLSVYHSANSKISSVHIFPGMPSRVAGA